MIFEAYSRQLMAMKTKHSFKARLCVVTKHGTYRNDEDLELGGCKGIHLTNNNAVDSAKRLMEFVFHPIDTQHKLIDFMYQDSLEVFHAFQVTLAKDHRANLTHVDA